MFIRNLVAVIWLVIGAGGGYWAYKTLTRRYGRRAFGRFGANWAFATGLSLGLGGCFVLWNGGRGGGEWVRGRYVEPYQWQWSGAIGFALVFGLLLGALLTWGRQPSSYAFDVPATGPFIDEEEVAEILRSEASADAETCRRLAASLVAESRMRQQPLPRKLERFVQRHLPGRLTRRCS